MNKLRPKAGAKSRIVFGGLLDGLAGPADLISGKYETRVVCRRATVADAWIEVGKLLDSSIRDYGVQHPHLQKPRAATQKVDKKLVFYGGDDLEPKLSADRGPQKVRA